MTKLSIIFSSSDSSWSVTDKKVTEESIIPLLKDINTSSAAFKNSYLGSIIGLLKEISDEQKGRDIKDIKECIKPVLFIILIPILIPDARHTSRK